MIFPISDSPNPKGAAPVTWALIALNVVLYVFVTVPMSVRRADIASPEFREYVETMAPIVGDRAGLRELVRQTSAYDLFVFAHGYRPSDPSVADLFSSLFLHGGFLHLAGNMLFLWIYGDNVERRLGPVRSLFYYLLTGVVATLTHALFAADSPVPLVGASGAISGVLGFYFLWFPRNRVRLLWLLPPILFQTIEVPARLVLGLYLIVDNLLPFVIAPSGGGVAHGAHIGGFVAGLAVAWLQDRRLLARSPWTTPPLPGEPAGPEAIQRFIDEEEFGEAAAAYLRLPQAETKRLLSPDQAVVLAAWLRSNSHPDAALVVLRRAIHDWRSGPGLDEVHLLLGEILLDDFGEVTAAYQYLLGVLDLDPEPETEAEARRALARIASLQKWSGSGVRS